MINAGWYTELSPMWPGQGLTLKIKEILYRAKSDFQDVCVFESESMGTVLLLDGVIQCTDRDEFSYQEMIAHIPMCSLERPAKKVLVVGGGDGGVLRELARYPYVEEIHMAEIDRMVPEVSKRFFPEVVWPANGRRIEWTYIHTYIYIHTFIHSTSSSRNSQRALPIKTPFFEALHRAVRPGGIVCTQAESLWLHLDIIKALADMCTEVFQGGSVSYATTTIPSYPSGQIGMLVCAKARSGAEGEGDGPLDPRIARQQEPGPLPALGVGELRYYSHEVHSAAFALPVFAKKALGGCLTFQ
ncbi:hypothetical protein VOLCADRAFT_55771 [Volvox carteri f. nagariensis]|uniref:spermidine synthase n=1 Tax=Volvox carteri f. nagariensis TaxID=3068 RepID=D8TIX2_VOLCA|nr:uncharacterized protein VOLCADRAFT_55771 [Volvox carteri f. nagariensis]EFJ52441.1 hypothetical protein VOLCADRAFT_55771 [Volvox carteri f. nagariensis]|eukprot:XP_002946514.1 hypothetical protein VOLCADRAFT_55771 [Volvox carteri f. nagariensis]